MPPLLPSRRLTNMSFGPTAPAVEIVIAALAADSGVGEAHGAPGYCWVFGFGGGGYGFGV